MKPTTAAFLLAVAAFVPLTHAQSHSPLPTLSIDPTGWIKDPTIIDINPGDSINDALKQAKPGTVFRVHAGEYKGAVNLSGLHGTRERPIVLISADGPGKARLVGNPKAKEATIGAWGISFVGVYGFEINCDTGEGDHGGVKIGGGWTKPADSIVIAGNLFTGKGTDGCKFLNGARNIIVAGNVMAGSWREECFDNVSVEKSIFAYNTTADSDSYWTSLTMKGGSRDIEVVGNQFTAKTKVQLSIGGYGNFRNLKQPPYWASGFQASRVRVYQNEIGGPQSIAFAGGQDSEVSNNLVTANVTQASAGQFDVKGDVSKNNTLSENTKLPGTVGAANLPADLLDLRPGGGFVKNTK